MSTGSPQYLGFHSRNGRTGKQDSWEAPEPRRDVGLEASGAWWGIAVSLEQVTSCPGPRLSSLQMSTVNFKNLTYFQKYLLSTYFMPSGHIRLCYIKMSAGPLESSMWDFSTCLHEGSQEHPGTCQPAQSSLNGEGEIDTHTTLHTREKSESHMCMCWRR